MLTFLFQSLSSLCSHTSPLVRVKVREWIMYPSGFNYLLRHKKTYFYFLKASGGPPRAPVEGFHVLSPMSMR